MKSTTAEIPFFSKIKLQSFTLQIFEPEQTLSFYINVLGFSLLNEFLEDNSTYYNLYLENEHFNIQLKYSPSLTKTLYQQTSTDNYWKYSLFVTDIQKIYTQLQNQNHKIGEPYQFGDIGYLSHTIDIENHHVEYIQKTFKQNKQAISKTDFLFKEDMALGLLTIRTKDPVKSIKFYEEILELKLLVRMYVDRSNGFTLYFLGDKTLRPPNPDIDAIENREWMYQQSHLFIEIQHYWGSEYDKDFSLNSTSINGLQTINFSGNIVALKEKLKAKSIMFNEEVDKVIFYTVDKHKIVVKKIK